MGGAEQLIQNEQIQLSPIERVMSVLEGEEVAHTLEQSVPPTFESKRASFTAEHKVDFNNFNRKRVGIERHFDRDKNIDHPLTLILIKGLAYQAKQKGYSGEELRDHIDTFALGYLSTVAPIVGLRTEDLAALTTPEAIAQKLTQIEPVLNFGKLTVAKRVLTQMSESTENLDDDEIVKKFNEKYVDNPQYATETCGEAAGRVVLEAYMANQSSVSVQYEAANKLALANEERANTVETELRALQAKYAQLATELAAKTQELTIAGNALRTIEGEQQRIGAHLGGVRNELETEKVARITAEETRDKQLARVRELEQTVETNSTESDRAKQELQRQLNEALGEINDDMDGTYITISNSNPDKIKALRRIAVASHIEDDEIRVIEQNLIDLRDGRSYGALDDILEGIDDERMPFTESEFNTVLGMIQTDARDYVSQKEEMLRATQLAKLLKYQGVDIASFRLTPKYIGILQFLKELK